MNKRSIQNQFLFKSRGSQELAATVTKAFVRHLLLSIFSLLTLVVVSPHAGAQTCESAFLTTEERLASLNPAFLTIADRIRMLPTDLISGERTPNWHDFNDLNIIIQKLRATKALLITPEQIAEFNAVVTQMARDLDWDPKLKRIATARGSYRPTNSYWPTEYKLKLQYQQMLGKLNHEFPRGARIPIQRLPVDLRREGLNQSAREVMANLEKSFEQRFPTTGFKTYEEYEAYLRGSDDPYIKKAVEMIDKGQIEVVIRRPESGRFWVPKVGFQNQHVTGTSMGLNNSKYRRTAETRLYDFGDETAYSGQDPELMPKYGTFRPATESGVSFNGANSRQYGSDFYVLRLSDIQDRLSFMPNDSLHVGGKKGPLTHWSGSVIPWKYRLLMVEFMKVGLRMENSMSWPSPDRWTDLVPNSHLYWETQILGAVDLSNVESFHFTSENPPSGAFLRDLLNREIPIYDARKWPPVKWTPSPEALAHAQAGGM